MGDSVQHGEATLAVVLIQLIIIILCARAAGAAAAAMRQPRAVGEIVAGLLLGPSFFGHFLPDVSAAIFTDAAGEPMRVLSQIGLILLMFQIGSDFEFGHLDDRRNARAAFYVSIASVGAPLVSGFILGRISAPILAPGVAPLAYALFVAIALAITAVPILGRILREYSLTRSDVGVIAISAAAANDVVGWFLLAGVAAFASSAFAPGALALKVAGLVALVALLRFAGSPLAALLLRRFPVEESRVPTQLMAIVLALIFAMGVATQALGIFTIFGGFLLGLVFHRHHAFVEAWREQIGKFVLVFFLPIFFTYTGLRTNVLGLDSGLDWLWCAIIFATAVASKLIPIYFAARIAGLPSDKSMIISTLMNTRALMELIVLNIGLTLGVIPPDVFTMLVVMALGTTVMTGPLLHLLLKRAGARVDTLVEA